MSIVCLSMVQRTLQHRILVAYSKNWFILNVRMPVWPSSTRASFDICTKHKDRRLNSQRIAIILNAPSVLSELLERPQDKEIPLVDTDQKSVRLASKRGVSGGRV